MFALTEAPVRFRYENDFLDLCCQSTLLRTFMKNDVWFSSLYSERSADCFQKEIADSEEGKTGRQSQGGHALHPCHSLLSLYHLSVSDELWMRL